MIQVKNYNHKYKLSLRAITRNPGIDREKIISRATVIFSHFYGSLLDSRFSSPR